MNKPIKILVMEDSEDETLLIVREIQRGGYVTTFERVETGAAMSAALKNQEWDIIIADYNLPHFGTAEALKIFKNSGMDIPFIVVSGSIGEDTAVATMKAGAHDYLMKNSLNRLVPVIERELQDARVRQGRKRDQEALRQSEENFRALAENANDGICIVVHREEKHRCLFLNRRASEILGYTREEAIRTPSFLLVHPDQRSVTRIRRL